MKNLLVGNYDSIVTRNLLFGKKASESRSYITQVATCPAIVTVAHGSGRRQRHWGVVHHGVQLSTAFIEV